MLRYNEAIPASHRHSHTLLSVTLTPGSQTIPHSMARLHHLAAMCSLFSFGHALPHDTPGHGHGRPTPINHRTAEEVISHLNLIPNTAEKGYFFETFRDEATVPGSNRSYSTAIYYLLEGREGSSVWHRLDAPEVWHYYAGAPLTLSLWTGEGEAVRDVTMGPDVFGEQLPQVVIGRGEWQSARSEGGWTLVGTTVSPGFEEGGSEFAEPGWAPPGV